MTTTAVQKTEKPAGKPSALALMASRLSVDPQKLLETLKATVFQKATNEELLALVTVANEYGLNPFLKELYAFPAKGGGIVPIVSVDGWNKILIRQPDFDGIEFDFTETEQGDLIACTATIFVKGRSRPVKITEYYSECKRNTDPWNNMPRRMLRNRTLCQASRVAFGFSGIYNEDEAATVVEVQATTIPTEPPPKLVAAPDAKVNPTPQSELEGIVTVAGFSFEQFRKWASETGNIQDADSIGTFAEIAAKDATRMIRAKLGLVKELQKLFPPTQPEFGVQ